MKTFDVITIFPEIISGYANQALLYQAQKKKIIKVRTFNPRDFTKDRHRTVDDAPYGGGPGMVMKVEPIYKAVQKAKKGFSSKKTKTILFSLKGERFSQFLAKKLLKYHHFILIAGRYEGVDERVAKHIADYEISIGDFVLAGGELPALIFIEALTRLVPGVIGNQESIEEERLKKFFQKNILKNKNYQNLIFSYPVYTRPAKFYPNPKNKRIVWKVPEVLLSGNHQKIFEWRKEELLKAIKKKFKNQKGGK